MEIKVLATKGCANCNAFYENVCKAVEAGQFNVTVTKIDDLMAILSYKVLSMPALIINEKVVHYGKKLSVEEIKQMLDTYQKA